MQEGHFTLPNANSPSARAQNRGFCVRKSNFSQVLPPLEHKIGVFVLGKSNRGEGVGRKGAVISETLTALNIQKKSFFVVYSVYLVILRQVLVRSNAINRESGENPEQTRYCNSFKTRQHNVTVGTADGKALVSRISQETCQDNILFCSFRVILPQNSYSAFLYGMCEYGLLRDIPIL